MNRPPVRIPFSASGAIAFLSLACLALPAAAQMTPKGEIPNQRLFYRNLAIFRYNPIGLQNDIKAGYRLKLYDNANVALRENFVALNAISVLSPGMLRFGAMAELQPLSMLNLSVAYESTTYLKISGLMQSYPDARADFSDTRQKETEAAGQSYVGTGSQLTLGAVLQAKVKDVAFRTNWRHIYMDMGLRGQDQLFYDIYYDVLAPNRGWVTNVDTDVLYQHASGLTVGLRHTATRNHYKERHYGPDVTLEQREELNPLLQRVGPLVAYTFFQEDGRKFNGPTVLLIVNWWLSHRYRLGQDVKTPQALPYFVLGFSFSGDLLPHAGRSAAAPFTGNAAPAPAPQAEAMLENGEG